MEGCMELRRCHRNQGVPFYCVFTGLFSDLLYIFLGFSICPGAAISWYPARPSSSTLFIEAAGNVYGLFVALPRMSNSYILFNFDNVLLDILDVCLKNAIARKKCIQLIMKSCSLLMRWVFLPQRGYDECWLICCWGIFFHHIHFL